MVLLKLVKALVESLDDGSVVFAFVHSEYEATGCIIITHGRNDLIDGVDAGLCSLLEVTIDTGLDNALGVLGSSAPLAELIADDAHQQGGERGVAGHTLDDLLE